MNHENFDIIVIIQNVYNSNDINDNPRRPQNIPRKVNEEMNEKPFILWRYI